MRGSRVLGLGPWPGQAFSHLPPSRGRGTLEGGELLGFKENPVSAGERCCVWDVALYEVIS